MEFIINMMAGDWSDDGHGITQSTIIRSNLTKDQIKEAYKSGTEIIGFDLREDVCRNYEDDKLSGENIKKLKANGINLFFQGTYGVTDGGAHINPEEFTEVYIKICQLGNPNFKCEIIDIPDVHIGGYGLFYS